MKTIKNFYLISNVLLFLSISGFAQQIPDYPERTFQQISDSLKFPTQFYTTQATEGSIDPNEYYVGPGDKLFMSISGVKEVVYNLVINQEGWLYIPSVGGIDLQNLTLSDAKNEILKRVDQYYKDVEVFISLVDLRKIRVSLAGDVINPSSYLLSANSRLLDLISNSAGLTKTADFRNIKIISKDGSIQKIDLLSFLRIGDYANNPLLREGDVIIVDRIDKIVRISGMVKFPAIYEFVEGESAYDLIKLAGGFLSTAKADTIEIIDFTDDGKLQESKYYSLEELQTKSSLLKNRDHVLVRQLPEYLEENYVTIKGFVNYAGVYKIIKGVTTLKDIIEEAGGFREGASLTEATLTRMMQIEEKDPEYERLRQIEPKDMTEDEYDYFKAKSRQNTGRVVVDFVELFTNNNLNENLLLKRYDVINVPEKKNYINMLGQFINPGKIIYDPNRTVDDYIDLAGGFGWRALESEVRVIKANTGEWIDADDVKQLKPGDTIWVPENPPGPKFWEVFMNGLAILAQLAAIVAAAVVISR